MAIYKKYKQAYNVLKDGSYDYEGDEPVKHIHGRFIAEYGWRIGQVGEHKALTDWLQGLALNIPYTYSDIMETFGITEKQTESYWRFMAMRLNELFRAEGLNVKVKLNQ